MGGRYQGREAMRNFGSKYEWNLKKIEEKNGEKMGLKNIHTSSDFHFGVLGIRKYWKTMNLIFNKESKLKYYWDLGNCQKLEPFFPKLLMLCFGEPVKCLIFKFLYKNCIIYIVYYIAYYIAYCLMYIVYFRFPIVFCLLSVVYFQLPNICCLLSIVYCLLSIVYCLLSIVYCIFSTV